MKGAWCVLNYAHACNIRMTGFNIWRDPLHSPCFRLLVQKMLELYWRHGVLADIPYEDIPLIAELACHHDIGKQELPHSVIYKPGPLTPEENVIMRSHTLLGAYMVEDVYRGRHTPPEAIYLYEICRHHHERWDGGGYPDGLQRDEIPCYVQIIGLADALDALLTKRSYRPALKIGDAISLIIKGGCGVFSPQIRAIFDYAGDDLVKPVYDPEQIRAGQEPKAYCTHPSS